MGHALECLIADTVDTAESEMRDMCNSDLQYTLDNPHDFVHEICDPAVPIYTGELLDIVTEEPWMLTELPELGEGENCEQTLRWHIYEALQTAVFDAVEEFKDNEEDEQERFRGFLDDHARDGERFEDAEEAYLVFESPRDSIESYVYEEIFEDAAEEFGWVTEDDEEI